MTALTASGYSIPALRNAARITPGRKFYAFSAAAEGMNPRIRKEMQRIAEREARRLRHHFPLHGGFHVSLSSSPRGAYDIKVWWDSEGDATDREAFADENR